MIYLIFAIVFSTLNHLLFKAFARLRINLLSAIVTNYAVCVVIGYSSSLGTVSLRSMFAQNWYPFSVLQGILLAACFFLIGRTTEKQGVAIASLTTRLSVAIPTFLAFLLYDDVVTIFKIIGIITALVALFLSGTEDTDAVYPRQAINILPFLLFVSFGTHSTLIKFVQVKFLLNTSYHIYVMAAFLWAFLISGLVLAWGVFKKKQAGEWKDIFSGFILGCTNYGSVYFLIKALSVPGWQSSQVFPTISVTVVSISSLGAWAIFNERLHLRMLLAIVVGLGSIVLVNL